MTAPVKILLPIPDQHDPPAKIEVLVHDDGEIELGAGWWMGEYRERMTGWELDRETKGWDWREAARAEARKRREQKATG